MANDDHIPEEFSSLKLSKEEIANPYLVIADLFNYAHLPDLKIKLWELLKAVVTSNYYQDFTPRERANLLHFYERLEKLLDAVFVINSPQLTVPSSQSEKS